VETLAEEQEDSGAERDGNRAEEPGPALHPRPLREHPASERLGRAGARWEGNASP
jgi:hypothetical protein